MDISTKIVSDCQDAVINLLQACAPCSVDWISKELKTQVIGVSAETASTYAVLALADLIRLGWVEQYDDTCDFDLTDKFYDDQVDDDPCCEDDGKDFETLKYNR